MHFPAQAYLSIHYNPGGLLLVRRHGQFHQQTRTLIRLSQVFLPLNLSFSPFDVYLLYYFNSTAATKQNFQRLAPDTLSYGVFDNYFDVQDYKCIFLGIFARDPFNLFDHVYFWFGEYTAINMLKVMQHSRFSLSLYLFSIFDANGPLLQRVSDLVY